MLNSLHIENIAVIERSDVEFRSGLNVLTGETGAGKSIMIDAINAVLGCRVNRNLVRTGCESASVSAVFTSTEGEQWCRENDIEVEDGEIILQRKLQADGKSSARVNSVPVTAAQLRDIGVLLLDIHGQNDGRQLLDEKRHLSYLDGYGVASDIIQNYSDGYKQLVAIKKEIRALQMDEDDKARLEESLRYRIDELTKANITLGEEDELLARRDLMHNSEKLREFLDIGLKALNGSDSNAISFLNDAEYAAARSAAFSPDMSQTEEAIRNARLALEDVLEQFREKSDALDFSQEEYNEIEERISLLHRLEKKYQTDEAGLIELLDQSIKRLDDLDYAGDRLIKLQKELNAAYLHCKQLAENLSAARKAVAEKLEKQVEQELRDLSMPSVRFYVTVNSREGDNAFDSTGQDDVYFTMSANAGEAPGPISKIASGGELARIMLALKNVFAEKDVVETLIFDEIDTGVSGVAAQRVAEKMAKLGRTKQVLCVTHLPQIAAMADEQYLVYKEERNNRTYTCIQELDFEGRQKEIARINGGDSITETMLQSVAEMLNHAQEYRNNL